MRKGFFIAAILFMLPCIVFATYLERSDYAKTEAFQARVQYAMQTAAGQIMNESASTPNHAQRIIFAKKVLVYRHNINACSMLVTTETAVGTAIDGGGDPTDAEIQNAVNAFWNAWSGVST